MGLSCDSFGGVPMDASKGKNMKQTDMDLFGIGRILREAREEKGLELNEISSILRIRETHLAALENDDYETLPGKVYAIGFIRTYGNYLGLDSADLIEQFKGVVTTKPSEELNYDVVAEAEPISPVVKIVAGVVLVLAIYFIWLFVGSSSEPTLVDDVVGVVEETVTETPNIAPAIEEAPQAAPIDVVDTPPEFADETPATTAVETIDAAPTELAEVDAPVPAEAAAVDVPKFTTNDVVDVRANRRAWMRIENGDGMVLFSSVVAEGQKFTLEPGQVYFLATRDAGALDYVINDNVSEPVGRRGQILTKRRLDRDAIIARQQ